MNKTKLNIDRLFSDKRTGKDKNFTDGVRSEYQRDFNRLIFSSAFRRLQNKTQVFPLPGSSFVHNRLTHSLEVSTVGKSLGKIAGDYISKNLAQTPDSKHFYQYELDNVIAAACLAHDIGNPAFGHSGESAISNYFLQNKKKIKSFFSKEEWNDLKNFEGNANALRILTHQFNGNLSGGLKLTYVTLATILKYPCESTGINDEFKHLKKYSFFQAEKNQFLEIVNEFNLIQENSSPIRYCRHPFVYLLEAADDITYTIVDFEDAHRLGILTQEEIEKKFHDLIICLNRPEDNLKELDEKLKSIGNENERISYLRGRAINALILEASDVFQNNLEDILNGQFNNTLTDMIKSECSAFQEIEDISYQKIYNSQSVVELELAGYNIMFELLDILIPSVLLKKAKRKKIDKKAIKLIPTQFGNFDDSESPYTKCLAVLDFISGMTDNYGTDLYRKIKGIEIGKHS